MDNVKFALTILTVAIIAGPLLVEVYAYKDNIVGLVLPPQIQNLINNQNSNTGGNGSLPELSQSLANFQLPQAAGAPQYDPVTGKFSYQFNFTNPLKTDLTINQLSAEVVTDSGARLGNVSITPTDLAAGATSLLNVTGNLNQTAVNQLENQYQSGSLDVSLQNVCINVGGITVNIDQIGDIGSILGSSGVGPSGISDISGSSR